LKWSQLHYNQVDAALVWMKTFSLLYAKINVNFKAGLGSWLGFSSRWEFSWVLSSKARNGNQMVATWLELG
jgi:hypothetical protein